MVGRGPPSNSCCSSGRTRSSSSRVRRLIRPPASEWNKASAPTFAFRRSPSNRPGRRRTSPRRRSTTTSSSSSTTKTMRPAGRRVVVTATIGLLFPKRGTTSLWGVRCAIRTDRKWPLQPSTPRLLLAQCPSCDAPFGMTTFNRRRRHSQLSRHQPQRSRSPSRTDFRRTDRPSKYRLRSNNIEPATCSSHHSSSSRSSAVTRLPVRSWT
uniref:(northern house mosquito) hypothetical protein n=1 Tax=Culex pipiens TaxID=7175 RepID=A0A8D8FCX6_CULPI